MFGIKIVATTLWHFDGRGEPHTFPAHSVLQTSARRRGRVVRRWW